METPSIVQCPVCNKRFPGSRINAHVNSCLGEPEDVTVIDVQPKESSNKRKSDSPPSQNGKAWSFMMTAGSRTKKTKHAPSLNRDTDSVIIDDSSYDKAEKCHMTTKNIDVAVRSTDHRDKPGVSYERFPRFSEEKIKVRESWEKRMGSAKSSSLGSCDVCVDINKLNVPLAEFMRPTSLDMYRGQEKAVGSNSMLGSLLHAKSIPSMILWGPPGCGKTTLAKIISNLYKERSVFKKLSAVNSGVKDVGEVVKQAKNDKKMFHKSTILFLDEIHRFNKTQQDSLLPHVEDGTITLIGATTENPSFQVNNALLSRCKVIVLEKLDCDAILKILISATEKLGYHVFDTDEDPCIQNSMEEPIREALSAQSVWIQKSALEFLTQICDGDARIALNGLQMAVQTQMSSINQSNSLSQRMKGGDEQLSLVGTPRIIVRLDHVKRSLQKSHIAYDKSGEEHFNILSAFHKSIRGSADSAVLYWLARMLEGGESPITVARRLVACATEDIGLADPQALVLAISAFQTVQFLGMPECEKALAECAVYLARAPKSIEVYTAYTKAKNCVWQHEGPLPSVPLHLRNPSNKFMKNLGYGKGYKYYDGNQEYLPDCMRGTNFFKEKELGSSESSSLFFKGKS